MLGLDTGHDHEELPGVNPIATQQDDDPIWVMGRGFGTNGPLTRRQLEREAKEELRQYAQSDIDRVMNAFDTWLAELQSTFASRVGPKLVAYAIQEILGVWENAATNGVDKLQIPDSRFATEKTPASPNGEPNLQSGELGAPEAVESPGLSLNTRSYEPQGAGDSPQAVPIEQATDHPTDQVEKRASKESQVLLWSARASEVLLYGNGSPQEQSVGGPSGANGESQKSIPTTDDGIYQGAVKLRVNAGASVQQMARFLRELRREEDMLIQQMVSDKNDGTHLWLGLRKPMHLKDMLLQMETVSAVDTPSWLEQDLNEPFFDVQLVADHDN